ncbi:hypothetical protein B0T10DRAFT_577035 [Thelonectria olida]|uniref:Uncharacterized protein n=1 Tax=Thelonectria olida TaxID=1576542 RepID=A0A9P8W058_9HYPO|nr:hypothetical protein B0T10DRAFT_577035 [Thelonectria olida]
MPPLFRTRLRHSRLAGSNVAEAHAASRLRELEDASAESVMEPALPHYGKSTLRVAPYNISSSFHRTVAKPRVLSQTSSLTAQLSQPRTSKHHPSLRHASISPSLTVNLTPPINADTNTDTNTNIQSTERRVRSAPNPPRFRPMLPSPLSNVPKTWHPPNSAGDFAPLSTTSVLIDRFSSHPRPSFASPNSGSPPALPLGKSQPSTPRLPLSAAIDWLLLCIE